MIAQTRTSNPSHVVMIGAHLDSVPEGLGIVDDGSGVACVLEIATRLGVISSVHNMVRFAFFGSEETGSQGSSGYLRGLSADGRKKIAMYVNVDIAASPQAATLSKAARRRPSCSQ
jgi:aminopeptidase S